MELTRGHFRAIIFYNFGRGLSQECIDELKSLFGNIELRKTGLMNSIVDDAHLKTMSVNVVQKQPLCQRALMACMNR